MAVPSSSPSKPTVSKSKKRPLSDDNGGQSQPKRTKSPGVRLVHGRIYDSENGKTCHQCRQKTMDFVASCKTLKGNKQCSLNMCHKCLLNRYGEKAEEVALLGDWSCPKCRGICNCSFCMKKMGHKPTGILVRAAKATGLRSVSELIQVKGVNNLEKYKVVASPKKLLSPKRPVGSNKESKVVSPRKLGKENSLDPINDVSLINANSTDVLKDKKSKKAKREKLKEISNGNKDGDACPVSSPKRPVASEVSEIEINAKSDNCETKVKKNKSKKAVLDKVSPSPVKSDNEVVKKNSKKVVSVKVLQSPVKPKKEKVKKESKGAVLDEVIPSLDKPENEKKKKKKDGEKIQDALVEKVLKDDNALAKKASTKPQGIKKCATSLELVERQVDLPLPEPSVLTTVWGIELSHEDIGNALQFLEFCAAFAKFLDVRKTQSQSILRELQRGSSGRRGNYSSAIRFHIQLLSLIQEDMGEESPSLSRKNSWLEALEKCISESECVPKELSSANFGSRVEEYDGLDFSRKLKLLNFLCDEALGTSKLRNWIDDENSKIAEKVKESKDKIALARNKEKLLKQKLLDDIATAIIAKNGAPLTISEHEDIVLHIKRDVAQVQEEILKSKTHSAKRKQKSDAIRSEPYLLDAEGRVFWKLGCCGGENEILLQDMGSWDADAAAEKWFIYGSEQKQEIDKYISSIRVKRARIQQISPVLTCGDISDNE